MRASTVVRALGRRGVLRLAIAAAVASSGAKAAAAEDFVAIIESVESTNVRHRILEYVSPGTVFELGPTEHLIIGYLGSCLRETITGGKVVVGQSQSSVTGGKVHRVRVECDGGQLLLTVKEAARSGVMPLRRSPQSGTPLTVHNTRPIFKVGGGANSLTIIPLDGNGPWFTLGVTEGFADLAGAEHELRRGRSYRVRAGNRSTDFKIHERAAADSAFFVERLVPL